MENDVLDSLEDIGYQGPLIEDAIWQQALEEGPKSKEYTKLVEWLTRELGGFVGIEEHTNTIASPEDADTFLMELSGFLREYGCPYETLSTGPIGQRLASKQARLHLLDYLLTELSAMRLTAVYKPHLVVKASEEETTSESDIAKHLKLMLVALSFPRPPDGITAFQLFNKVETKITELIKSTPPDYLSKPLLKARLSDKQWETVEFINKALLQEYECRRELLLKRLDVTIQSFKWSDKAKRNDDKLAAAYQPIRKNLKAKPNVAIHQMLAAREDLLKLEKTSSGDAREKSVCSINKVRIGNVPDRGGRAYEMEPPPPEMPAFMKRSNQPQQQRQGGRDNSGRGGHGGRGRGDRRGGDRVQGGWGDRPHSGGGGRDGGTQSWSQGQVQYHGQPQDQTPGQAFFGGGGGGGGYQQGGYSGSQNTGYHQNGGYNQNDQTQGQGRPQSGYQERGGRGRGGRGRGRGGGGRGGPR